MKQVAIELKFLEDPVAVSFYRHFELLPVKFHDLISWLRHRRMQSRCLKLVMYCCQGMYRCGLGKLEKVGR